MAARKKKAKKSEKKVSVEASALVAKTNTAAIGMDASIADPEDLGAEVEQEVTKAELSEAEEEISTALAGTSCWMAMDDSVLYLFGPTKADLATGTAKLWKVLGRLRREKKIDSLPQVKTEVAKAEPV